MSDVEISLKSASQPAPEATASSVLVLHQKRVTLRAPFPWAMLPTPVPVDQAEDIRQAWAALAEPGKPVPYEQIRKELNLDE